MPLSDIGERLTERHLLPGQPPTLSDRLGQFLSDPYRLAYENVVLPAALDEHPVLRFLITEDTEGLLHFAEDFG